MILVGPGLMGGSVGVRSERMDLVSHGQRGGSGAALRGGHDSAWSRGGSDGAGVRDGYSAVWSKGWIW